MDVSELDGYIVAPVGEDWAADFPDHWYAQNTVTGEFAIAITPLKALAILEGVE